MRTPREIGELIATQNNRLTANPMFVVQHKVRDWGYESDYTDDYAWLHNEEGHEVCEETAGYLESGELAGDNFSKSYFKERWEFVTACFTERGCHEYIDASSHRYDGELRVYVETSINNAEFQTVRAMLLEESE